MIEFLTADTSSTASLLVTFLPMVLILVFMYIILYLPQNCLLYTSDAADE